MRRHAILLALVSLSAVPAWSQAPPGVYRNVRIHQETGDILGSEVEIRPGPPATAVVTLCEGGDCRGGKIWPVATRGDHIEITVDQDFGPQITLVGRFRHGALWLEMAGDPSSREVLRRVRSPKPGQTAKLACGRSVC